MFLCVLWISLVSSCRRSPSPDIRIVNLDEGGFLHHIIDYDDYYDDTSSNQELLVPASNKIETSEGKAFVIYQAIHISIQLQF